MKRHLGGTGMGQSALFNQRSEQGILTRERLGCAPGSLGLSGGALFGDLHAARSGGRAFLVRTCISIVQAIEHSSRPRCERAFHIHVAVHARANGISTERCKLRVKLSAEFAEVLVVTVSQ